MDDAWTRGWTKEAYCGKMKETNHKLHACQSREWGMAAASKAVDQTCTTGTEETNPLILPAGVWQQRFKPFSELPSAGHQQSQAGEKGGHPAAGIAQVLKKGECFHFEKCSPGQALLCAELQTLLGQLVPPGAEQKGWDAAHCISTGSKQVCPNAEHRHRYKKQPFSFHSFLPWEGVHFSGLLKSTSADSSWMLPSETFLPSLEGCPHSHTQGPYINLLKHQKYKTECPSLFKWWHHGTRSLWLKKKQSNFKNLLELTSR